MFWLSNNETQSELRHPPLQTMTDTAFNMNAAFKLNPTVEYPDKVNHKVNSVCSEAFPYKTTTCQRV